MRARRQAVLVATVLAVVACRQVVGIGDPEPPLRCEAPASVAPACARCLTGECCAELLACRDDSSCRALLDCRAACADDGCRDSCERTLNATDVTAAVLACEAARCAEGCGLACGGAGLPITGCQPCASSCCGEGVAYRGNVRGQSLRACRARCAPSDISCAESCSNKEPEGADLERAAQECVARACDVTNNWSCIGKREPTKGTPTLSTITIGIVAVDLEKLKPVSGVTVRGCSDADLACAAPPHGTSVTGSDGRAVISVRLTPDTGFDAYAGFVELTDEEHVPGLVYFSPPLVRDTEIFVAMGSKQVLTRMGELSQTPLAPDRGVLLVGAFDCRRDPARGVSLRADTADALSRPFYLRSASAGGPTFDFAATSTTDFGVAGAYNLPAGPVTFTTVAEGLCLETGRATVGIRSGAVTSLNVP